MSTTSIAHTLNVGESMCYVFSSGLISISVFSTIRTCPRRIHRPRTLGFRHFTPCLQPCIRQVSATLRYFGFLYVIASHKVVDEFVSRRCRYFHCPQIVRVACDGVDPGKCLATNVTIPFQNNDILSFLSKTPCQRQARGPRAYDACPVVRRLGDVNNVALGRLLCLGWGRGFDGNHLPGAAATLRGKKRHTTGGRTAGCLLGEVLSDHRHLDAILQQHNSCRFGDLCHLLVGHLRTLFRHCGMSQASAEYVNRHPKVCTSGFAPASVHAACLQRERERERAHV
mmetsp:Transcript_115330/g.246473  ORF Transcript_115330/g.246473 Transcript_115330/m.246473 type:complete len:284 (-) Transcript_115330:78-929(-)